MKPFPHHYAVETDLVPNGRAELVAEGLPAIISALWRKNSIR